MPKANPESLPADEDQPPSNGRQIGVIESPPSTDPRIRQLSETYLKDLTEGIRDRFGNGPPDPEDVAQEAFSRVLEMDNTASIRNLKGYLWRTARNLIFDAGKASRARERYDFEVEEIFFPLRGDNCSPENVISAKEQLSAINTVLRNMPEKQRRAIVLYRIEGMTLEEVARRLRISRTSVSNHIAKAHAQINALFVDDTFE